MLNRVRLPFHLSKPQYLAEEDVYLKGNGTRVVLKSIVTKVMEGNTDYMPSLLHERLSIALRHDIVNVESDKYSAAVKLVGAYEIDWQNFLDYPFAPANFKAFEEAFVARSNRCDICAESNFLVLRDDYEPSPFTEGEEMITNVVLNDSICCSSPVFSIFSYDTDLIDSISISSSGIVTWTLKIPLNSYTNKELFVYRVTCGTLEETATFTGNINGSLSTPCESPSNLVLSLVTPSSNPYEIQATWDAPGGGPPAGGYDWVLLDATDTEIGSGNTTDLFVNVNFLDCAATYTFFVRAICAVDDESADLTDEITIPDCATGEDMFLINNSGIQIEFDIDFQTPNYIFPAGTTSGTEGDVIVYPNSILTNLSGISLRFRFLSAMPSTEVDNQVVADGFTYVFPADVTNYNFCIVEIP